MRHRLRSFAAFCAHAELALGFGRGLRRRFARLRVSAARPTWQSGRARDPTTCHVTPT
ncbi:hypothetical protein PF005_g3170 [Phytophthora fragariae]|uniref:Uncharacterized protein n=2 Tax=Phytophthora TaxID=4783 RepID=A0A6A3M8Z4_9STRA|nr:hypothetical protein PF003_g25872 [Phytophthora fragariae]KAE9047292.1 hypothetical protein PR002_g1113 [Phytophthora rubi]KAE8947185.1 hypothetical protein PF009_g3183 [Phytophthora fragariae]KAE9026420.1 hypothetical protein PF011_g2546 [Phytophthora fragariae]KAE9051894.1 hypothetical protein PR001_g990 [Phytophthora rubi]